MKMFSSQQWEGCLNALESKNKFYSCDECNGRMWASDIVKGRWERQDQN
jgi:hypothetical protein